MQWNVNTEIKLNCDSEQIIWPDKLKQLNIYQISLFPTNEQVYNPLLPLHAPRAALQNWHFTRHVLYGTWRVNAGRGAIDWKLLGSAERCPVTMWTHVEHTSSRAGRTAQPSVLDRRCWHRSAPLSAYYKTLSRWHATWTFQSPVPLRTTGPYVEGTITLSTICCCLLIYLLFI
jgi:hypothetical protein